MFRVRVRHYLMVPRTAWEATGAPSFVSNPGAVAASAAEDHALIDMEDGMRQGGGVHGMGDMRDTTITGRADMTQGGHGVGWTWRRVDMAQGCHGSRLGAWQTCSMA